MFSVPPNQAPVPGKQQTLRALSIQPFPISYIFVMDLKENPMEGKVSL